MDNNNAIVTPDKVAITFTLPNPKAGLIKIKNRTIELFSVVYNPVRNQVADTGSAINSRVRGFKTPKFNFNKKKILKIAFPLVIAVIIVSGIAMFVNSIPDAQSTPDTQVSSNKPEIIATKNINKLMAFPLRDEKGKEVGKYEYEITSAELRNRIIVQGRGANAIDGRVFLIFNLKLKNSIDKSLQLNTRDYVRVVVVSNPNEKLAADIHNDPVEVQAISTKYTRIGLAINESDSKKPIKVQIGEIGGAKQEIELKF